MTVVIPNGSAIQAYADSLTAGIPEGGTTLHSIVFNDVSTVVAPAGGATPTVTTPSVPTSTTAVTNTTGYTVAIYVEGGTVTVVDVGGVATGIAASPFVVIVPNGQTVAMTYTGSPTWKWMPVGAPIPEGFVKVIIGGAYARLAYYAV
jgi:uncharacterized protein (DUF362 family)